jgi:hypothetical protein
LGLVVVPNTGANAVLTVLEPLDALEVLAASSFNVVALDHGLDLLVRLVAEVPVVALPTVPLSEVAARLRALVTHDE